MSQTLYILVFLLVCFVTSNNGEVTLTQDITNDSNNTIVCPGTTVVFTCISNKTAAIVWENELTNETKVINASHPNGTLGNFTIQLMYQSLGNFSSKATINVTSHVSLSCSDGSSNKSTITIYIIEKNFFKTAAIIGVTVVIGGVAGIFGPPLIVTGLGFSSGGIVSGSIGASMMSAWAPTAAGGIVATFQSVGAAGFSAIVTAAMGAVGSSIGAGIGVVTDTLFKCN